MCSIKQTLVLCKWEKMVCQLMLIIFTLRFRVMINILNTLIGITFWCSHVLSFWQTIYFWKDLIYVVKPTPFRRCIFGDFLILFFAMYLFFNFFHSFFIWAWFLIGSLPMKLHCNVLLWINLFKVPFANSQKLHF